MTLILKASNAADLLAMVPSLVGFEPHESLVLVIFRGRRTAGAMRFDLPRSDSTAVHHQIANIALGMLSRLVEIDWIVPVVYTDTPFAGARDIPCAPFAELVLRRLRHSGFESRDALCRAPDGWASYLDPVRVVGGHPLSEIEASHVTGRLPEDWRRLPDIQDLPSRIPDADPEAMTRTAEALEGYRDLNRRLGERIDDDDVDSLEGMLTPLEPLGDLPLFAEEALEWDATMLESQAPLLLFALQGPPARDLVMLQWATSLEVGDAMFDDPREVEVAGYDIGDLMMGKSARPDPDRLARGIRILHHLVSRAPDEARRAPLCMLAWSSWALGRASHAARYVAEVRAIDPDYGMGELLETILLNFPVPDWAFEAPPRAGT